VRLVSYTLPRIDVLVSSVFQDKPNVGTDQIVSLVATYTLSAADIASAAAQLGRPLTNTAPQVNLLAPGELYGRSGSSVGPVLEEDLPLRQSATDGGRWSWYNLLNNKVTLLFNQTFGAEYTGLNSPSQYMNPRVFV
jgi:hypothetical protein